MTSFLTQFFKKEFDKPVFVTLKLKANDAKKKNDRLGELEHLAIKAVRTKQLQNAELKIKHSIDEKG